MILSFYFNFTINLVILFVDLNVVLFVYNCKFNLIYLLEFDLNEAFIYFEGIVGFNFMRSFLNSFVVTLLGSTYVAFFVCNPKSHDSYFLVVLLIFLFSFIEMIVSFGNGWSFILFICLSYFYVDITLGFLGLTIILIYFFK